MGDWDGIIICKRSKLSIMKSRLSDMRIFGCIWCSLYCRDKIGNCLNIVRLKRKEIFENREKNLMVRIKDNLREILYSLSSILGMGDVRMAGATGEAGISRSRHFHRLWIDRL